MGFEEIIHDEQKRDAPIAESKAIQTTSADRLRKIIRNLLQRNFGEDVIVVDFEATDLVDPGNNYGSSLLAVKVTVQRNRFAMPKVVEMVAKMLPSEFFQKVFNSAITFPKEIAAYEEIIPAYRKLQLQNGVPRDQLLDVFPKYYASTITKDLNAKGNDDDAVILMENLGAAGYSCGNRWKGLDRAHSEMAVRNLAVFHALSIGLKIKKPELFARYKAKAVVFAHAASAIRAAVENRKKMALESEWLNPFYSRIAKALETGAKTLDAVPSDHFGCICHADFWVNNIMFHHDADGNPDDMKIIDFQTYSYQSPVRDLLFFLITSTAEIVLLCHFDHLINLYHEQFIKTLESINCDTSTFGRSQFMAECKKLVAAVALHCCLMVKIILLPASDAENNGPSVTSLEYFDNLDFEAFRERLTLMFQCFLERNWI